MLPMGSGVKKPWGKSNYGFVCCWGTLSEQFSKLSDSIYFESNGEVAPAGLAQHSQVDPAV